MVFRMVEPLLLFVDIWSSANVDEKFNTHNHEMILGTERLRVVHV